ncbi:MAG: hypothetical protein NZ942_00880 [Candidatus Aenigmarchaeota archaeon]|nr:hypothetical protein [Candidatus Aenigmarchaeota archaeon]
MPITLADITPIALCISTQELFDAKRFQLNFCDNLLLRAKDEVLEPTLTKIKRELNTKALEKKFLDGYKVVIISNIDKILGLVASRYAKIDLKLTQNVITEGKDLIERVSSAQSFEEIAKLEPIFKSKITLPVYEMFSSYLKQARV